MTLAWRSFETEGQDLWANVGLAVACPAAGALILRRVHNLVGWLLIEAGVAASILLITLTYAERALVDRPGSLPAGSFAAWVANWAWVLGFLPVMTLLPLLFPDGEVLSRRWRWFVGVAVAAIAIGVLGGMLMPEIPIRDREPIANPLIRVDLGAITGIAETLFALCVPVGLLSGLAAVVVRWRRGSVSVRQQLKWLVLAILAVAAAVTVGTVLLAGVAEGVAAAVAVALLPAAIAVAVVQHRLYDIDVLVNRALVYVIAGGLLLAAYLAVVAAVAAVIDGAVVGPALGTGVIAVAFAPVRVHVQRRVNRFLYGDRGDPATALDRLGSRLAELGDAERLLDTLAGTIAEALRVPYVVVSTVDGQTGSVGRRPARWMHVDLVDRGEPMGTLKIGRRSERERFSRDDERLVEVLGRQAALVLRAENLQHDLRRAQARLIAAVEDERRRLRRDLHDGLGPTLAGIALSSAAVANMLEGHDVPAKASDRLKRIGEQAQAAAEDIRRLVYGLRPPALDELGLVGALSAHAATLGGPAGIGVSVQADIDDAELPAAIEVAVFRIACEALANTVRHSDAAAASLKMWIDGSIHLEVRDDGRGLAAGWQPGVGITSMRERAAQLGGTLCVASSRTGGTIVEAQLPMELL